MTEGQRQTSEKRKWGPFPTDPYEALGISRGASKAEIRTAHRKMSRKYHPDVNPDNKQEATEWAKIINEAKDLLLKPNFKGTHFKGFNTGSAGSGSTYRPRTKTEEDYYRREAERQRQEADDRRQRREAADAAAERARQARQAAEDARHAEEERVRQEAEEQQRRDEEAERARQTAEEQKRRAEKIENDNARREYFDIKNRKRPPEGTPEAAAYDIELNAKEEAYKATKRKIVESFLAQGEAGKTNAQEFLLNEVELKRKNDLENGLVGKKERIIAGVSKGIEKWDNFGKAEGMRGYLERLAKTGISLAMIGAISGLSVEGLAKMGIGTASALGGGVTSYLGKRLGMGLAMSAIMAKVPDDKKKWVSAALMAGSAGLVIAGGGALAAGGLVVASGIGLMAGQLTKKYGKNIEDTMKKAKEGKIDLATLAGDMEKMEIEMEQALKDAEKSRVVGKIKEGAIAVGASMLTLEVMGHIQDDKELKSKHEADTKKVEESQRQHEEDIKIKNALKGQLDRDSARHNEDVKTIDDLKAQLEAKGNPEAPQLDPNTTPATSPEPAPTVDPNQPASTPASTTPTETLETDATMESISVTHGNGGIQEVLDLKAHIQAHYHGDYSNAPKDIQELMSSNKNAVEYAIKLGLYNPDNANESALLHEGSTFKIDYATGNVSFHDARTGEENILMHGDNSKIDQYQGKMFHSEHKVESTPTTSTEHVNTPRVEETPEPINQEQLSQLEKLGFKGDPNDRKAVEEFFAKTHTGNSVAPEPDSIPQRPLTPEELKQRIEHSYGVSQPGKVNITEQTSDPSKMQTGKDYTYNAGAEKVLNSNTEAIKSLHLPSEFKEMHYDLSYNEIKQVAQLHQENIEHILPPDKSIEWLDVKNLSARALVEKGGEYAHKAGYEKIIPYLERLIKVADLDPKGGLFRREETLGQFFARALEKVADDGNLSAVKLK